MVTLERDFTLKGAARRSLTQTTTPIRCAASRFSVVKPRWHSAVLDGLTATRELLDRLEHAGWTRRVLLILDDARFEVRWRDPLPDAAGGSS